MKMKSNQYYPSPSIIFVTPCEKIMKQTLGDGMTTSLRTSQQSASHQILRGENDLIVVSPTGSLVVVTSYLIPK